MKKIQTATLFFNTHLFLHIKPPMRNGVGTHQPAMCKKTLHALQTNVQSTFAMPRMDTKSASPCTSTHSVCKKLK